MHAPLYLSIRDACARYGCSRSVLYRILGDGLIKAKKASPKMVLVDVISSDAYFNSLPDVNIKQDKHRSRGPCRVRRMTGKLKSHPL
jgi:hypothetical protein